MDAQRATAIGGAKSHRTCSARSGNNSKLPAIAFRMRNGDECFSESGAKCGFAGAQATFAVTGSQDKTRCGGSTAGWAMDCGGSNVSDGDAKRERRDADAKGVAESPDFHGGNCKISRIPA